MQNAETTRFLTDFEGPLDICVMNAVSRSFDNVAQHLSNHQVFVRSEVKQCMYDSRLAAQNYAKTFTLPAQVTVMSANSQPP